VVVGGFFNLQGLTLLAMYLLGTLTALAMAAVFKKTLLRGPAPVFIMELPPYRLPRLATMVRHTWDRAKLFLTRAGTIILAISVVLWALAYFPRVQGSEERVQGSGFGVQENASETAGGAQLRQSYLGRSGRLIEPVLRPLGFDWKIGIGIIASFAAREVFVSTMGVVYGVGGGADEENRSLRDKIRAERRADGGPVYTPLVGLTLMIFFALSCQCMSTLAVVRRETNSLRWPAFLFGYMTVLAWVVGVGVYQGGRLLGFG